MLIEIPIRIDEYGSDELIAVLKKCSTFKDEKNWRQLKSQLNAQISDRLEIFTNTNYAVNSILEAYQGSPQKIDGLLKAIKRIEGNTTQYRELYDVIFDIAQNQQEELVDEIFGNNLFKNKIIGENGNNVYEDFNSNWADLFEIIKDIDFDWEIIWKASLKTLSIRERNDWRNDIILKSLCFTKNSELLKPFFIQEIKYNILIDFANNLNLICRSSNQKIITWLASFQSQSDVEEQSKSISASNGKEQFKSIPVLIIVIDSDTTNNSWSVQAQILFRGKPKSLLSKESNTTVFDCEEFDNIPGIIENFIGDLNNPEDTEKIIIPQDLPIDKLKIDKLRIEVFLPISSLNSNFDCWATSSEELYNSLVEDNKLFIRSRDRYKGKKRKAYEARLKEGWHRLDLCIENCSEKLNMTELAEEIENTKKDSDILKIVDKTQVDNWTALKNFIVGCDRLWGVKLLDTLPEDPNEKGKFFNTIYSSGIPVVFWDWESIPEELLESFESGFNKCLNKQYLTNRCHILLEKIWKLRSDAWGYSDDNKRKKALGYYFGLLLEDPEIMFDERILKTHEGRR